MRSRIGCHDTSASVRHAQPAFQLSATSSSSSAAAAAAASKQCGAYTLA